MIKVLQVTSKLFRGGAESFIINLYRRIDRERFQFDFLTFRSPREFYEDEIEILGGNVFHVPIMEGANFLKRKKMLDDFFEQHHNYDAIHGHMAALGDSYLAAAERVGIPKRFSHSHVSSNYSRTPRGYIKRHFEQDFGRHATKRFACSTDSGIYMYGDQPFEIVNNGIDTTRFTFNDTSRKKFRAQIGIDDETILLGHVGRFAPEKNHKHLIDIFSYIVNSGFQGKLLLAGDGSLRSDIEQRVRDYNLAEKVIFLGAIEDMPEFYSAIDLFIMPSFSEGLPFSAIEAQCSGLPCILSNGISEETKLTEHVAFLPLDISMSEWSKQIHKQLNSKVNRSASPKDIENAGYDIRSVVSKLETYYSEGQF